MPALIRGGVNLPYVGHRGAAAINTHPVFVPSVVVSAAFKSEGLTEGITFLGQRWPDAAMSALPPKADIG